LASENVRKNLERRRPCGRCAVAARSLRQHRRQIVLSARRCGGLADPVRDKEVSGGFREAFSCEWSRLKGVSMGKRVLQYQDEPVRAVRVVARRANQIVALTPVRHTQCPFDEPVISFQPRWLLKRDPSLANATFHLVPASEVEPVETTRVTKPVIETLRVLDLTEAKSKTQQKANDDSPIIQHWIRDFRYPGWTNVFDLVPHNEHLYGTET